jgi:hypothetical protein
MPPSLRHPRPHRREPKQLHPGAAQACNPQARTRLHLLHDQPRPSTSACCLRVTSRLCAYAPIWFPRKTLLRPIHHHRQVLVWLLPRLLQVGQSQLRQNAIYVVVMWTFCKKEVHSSGCCIEGKKNIGPQYGLFIYSASCSSCFTRVAPTCICNYIYNTIRDAIDHTILLKLVRVGASTGSRYFWYCAWICLYVGPVIRIA